LVSYLHIKGYRPAYELEVRKCRLAAAIDRTLFQAAAAAAAAAVEPALCNKEGIELAGNIRGS
jgi:hypothetical protein